MVASPFEKIEARLDHIEHWCEQQMEINRQVKARLDNLLALVETQSQISRALREKLDALKG